MTRTKKETTSTTDADAAPALDRVSAYARGVLDGDIVAGPHVRNACRRHFSDLKSAHKRGIHWDDRAAKRVFNFFERKLRLSEGQFDQAPFILQPMQEFILGSIFGWKRADGTRRFRRAYIECGKGAGKSPLVGGIGLYGLVYDDEPGAQIYAAAATKDQASILFRDAVKMMRQSPDLAKRIKPSGGFEREYNLAHLKSASFFRPMSKEAGKTGSGLRPHFALCDEVHEHPGPEIMRMLEAGFKFRRQPLLVMITNSGSDRLSVCWREHEMACAVAAGTQTPDEVYEYVGETWPGSDEIFSYVCALDTARTEIYDIDIALRLLGRSCTCNTVRITPTDLPSPQDFAALVIKESGGRITSPKGSGVLITPTVRLLLDAFATLVTQDGGKKIIQHEATSAALLCETTPKASTPKHSLERETQNTGNEKSNPTQRGNLTGQDCTSTASNQSKFEKSNSDKMAYAAYAADREIVSGWITATIQELYGVSYATPAMRELVCSEIVSRVWKGHSNTCECHQRFHLKSGQLAQTLPADDPFEDDSCWIKTNPLMGVTVSREYIASQVAFAKNFPSDAPGVLRLYFCVWTDAHSSWMPRKTVEKVMCDFDLPAAGSPVFLGVDLSRHQDLTCVAYVTPTGHKEMTRPDGTTFPASTFDAWVDSFTPADTLKERADRDKAPYLEWVKDGYIQAIPGERIRYDYVAYSVAQADKRFDIKAVAYDNYAYAEFKEACGALGLELIHRDHPQGGLRRNKPDEALVEQAKAEGLPEPGGLWMPGSIREVESLIIDGRIRLRSNPVLMTAMMAATFSKPDALGNKYLVKETAHRRIDPAVALCMAVGAAVDGAAESFIPTNPWEDPSFSVTTI